MTLKSKFQSEFKKDSTKIRELKTDNDFFRGKFKKFKSMNQPKIEEGRSEDNIEVKFDSLVQQYKNKNYIIPDLSEKNNIFELAPELVEDNKIAVTFCSQPEDGFLEGQEYINRLHSQVNAKMSKQYIKVPQSDPRIEQNKRKNLKNQLKANIAHNKKVQKAIDCFDQDDLLLESNSFNIPIKANKLLDTIKSNTSLGSDTLPSFNTSGSQTTRKRANMAFKSNLFNIQDLGNSTFERTQVRRTMAGKRTSKVFERFIKTIGMKMTEDSLRKVKLGKLNKLYGEATKTHFSKMGSELDAFIKDYSKMGKRAKEETNTCWFNKREAIQRH